MSNEVEVLLFGSSGAVTEDFRRVDTGSGTQAGKMYRICGPHQLAWWLREHGFETQVVNFFAFLSDQEVLKLCNKFIGPRTRIVGWSIMSQVEHVMGQTKRFLEVLLPQLKEQYPWVTWITGGPGVHYSSTRYTNKTGFDFYFFGYAENGVLALNALVSDQSPQLRKTNYWAKFLNIKVPVHVGAEQIAKSLNQSIVFYEVKKVKRGYYTCTFRLLAENPREYPDYQITDIFLREVEKQIKTAPQYYFWTHKRVKHKDRFEEFIKNKPDYQF